MTRLNVVHLDAPRSLDASINVGFNLSNELKIGKIINGIKIYTDTNIKLKSVNKNLFGSNPNHFKEIDLPVPYVPKMPKNA